MKNDLVSIIIPVYNVSAYLDNCIASASQQTYRNIEIILVDDGSTDDSPAICDSWAEKDPRIRVIHKQNGGVSAARNAGLDVANGTYIAFLDSDDAYVPHTIETALESYSEDTDLVSFAYTSVYEKKKQETHFTEKQYENQSDADRFSFIVGPFFRCEIGWNVWDNLFRKSIIDQYNLRFQVGHKMAEDKTFCLCYYAHCKKINVIDRSLYEYYMRTDSVTHVYADAQITYFDKILELSKAVLQHFSQCVDTQYFVQHYPIIHYFIFEADVKREEDKGAFSGLREKVIDSFLQESDKTFFFDHLRGFRKNSSVLRSVYDPLRVLEKKARAKWLLTGHSLWYTLLVKTRKQIRRK